MKSFFAHIIPDFLLIVGVASLLYGIYQIYTPAMFIVAGMLLISTFRPIITYSQKSNSRKPEK